MNSFSSKIALIRNSRLESLCFYLSTTKNIVYDCFDKKDEYTGTYKVTDKTIIDFDVEIDKKGIIHLLFLTTEGDLTYSIYNDNNWKSHVFTRLDTKSNIFDNLTLKIIANNIHIIYSQSNLLNSNLWTIYHILYNKKVWHKSNVISMTPGKSPDSFSLYYDKYGGIHLVYVDIEQGKHHIYYTTYNTFLKKWNKIPEKISDDNTDNFYPYLFIDRNDSIHVTWNTIKDNSRKLIYKKKTILSNCKHTWKKIIISEINENNSQPILFQENDNLKIIHINDNALRCYCTKDYGSTWDSKNSIESINLETLSLIKFVTNYPHDKLNLKMNYTYGNVKKKIQLYFSDEYKNLSEIFFKNQDDKTIYEKDNRQKNTLNEFCPSNDICKDSVEYNSEPNQIFTTISRVNENFHTKSETGPHENFDMLFDVKSQLDSLKNNTNSLLHETSMIEKYISKQVAKSSEKIFNNPSAITDIKKSLDTLEEKIANCIINYENMNNLLCSLESQCTRNSSELGVLQLKIGKIRDILDKSSTPKLLNKIINFLR